MTFLKNFFVEEDGQDMVEYGLVIALVVVAAAVGLGTFSTALTDGLAKVAASFTALIK